MRFFAFYPGKARRTSYFIPCDREFYFHSLPSALAETEPVQIADRLSKEIGQGCVSSEDLTLAAQNLHSHAHVQPDSVEIRDAVGLWDVVGNLQDCPSFLLPDSKQ